MTVTLTPDSHEASEEHSSAIIKEVGETRIHTTASQSPVRAVFVTEWTHGEVACSILITDFLTGGEECSE